ncbi:MAG TPA: DUF2778 domain-containing protein [Beijerinckiaceae bacterium]|jgi:hypothetical protein|nr:DUF2778 domain-containing protein [Beijerinckiaceae bacterium]
MTDTTAAFSEVALFNRPQIRQGASQRALARATAFAVGVAAVLVGWLMGSALVVHSPTGESSVPVQPLQATIVPDKSKSLANPYGELARAKRAAERPPLLSDPGFALDLFLENHPMAPVAAAPAAVNASPQVALAAPVDSVPLPPARPSFLRPHVNHETVEEAPAPRPAAPSAAPTTPTTTASAPSSTPSDNRSFFQKLFGMPSQAPSNILAYAQTALGSSAPYDPYTAVYDVAAHVVYMPDGEKLEAHSGLGDLLDDPGHVNAKDRGATPPHLYDLELRRQLFHGVQALRLDPVGSNGNMYGRVGLLAHTYMLGPKGDSNGCVSFRDYNKFLQAFMNGQVKHLVVVSHLT